MRLWHKDLIKVLPKQQLLGQWRECCLIAKSIHEKGSPNHILVNEIMNYPLGHLFTYGLYIQAEMCRRGYTCNFNRFSKWFPSKSQIMVRNIFRGWHNDRYLVQCYYNLQEKYDRGGISDEEWNRIETLEKVDLYWKEEEGPTGDISYFCPKCGVGGLYSYNYCPHCGRRLKKKK